MIGKRYTHTCTRAKIASTVPGQSQELESKNCILVSHMLQGPKHLGHLPQPSYVHQQGADPGEEQAGLKLVHIWDTSTTGGSLNYHSTVPTLSGTDFFFLYTAVRKDIGMTKFSQVLRLFPELTGRPICRLLHAFSSSQAACPEGQVGPFASAVICLKLSVPH